MALSNLRNEPRRELTESVIGVGFVSGLSWVLWWLAGVMQAADIARGKPDLGFANYLSGAVLLSICLVCLVMVGLFLTHKVGEVISDALASFNLDPRPRKRR